MISDVLFEARQEMVDYLENGRYGGQGSPVRKRIEAVMVLMDLMQMELDSPFGKVWGPDLLDEVVRLLSSDSKKWSAMKLLKKAARENRKKGS